MNEELLQKDETAIRRYITSFPSRWYPAEARTIPCPPEEVHDGRSHDCIQLVARYSLLPPRISFHLDKVRVPANHVFNLRVEKWGSVSELLY